MENNVDSNAINHEVKETEEPKIRVYMFGNTEVTIEGELDIKVYAKAVLDLLDIYY